jgi:hypothetical protein
MAIPVGNGDVNSSTLTCTRCYTCCKVLLVGIALVKSGRSAPRVISRRINRPIHQPFGGYSNFSL